MNPFGGIALNVAELERRGLSRREALESIGKGLREVKDPQGRPVVRWIGAREEVIPAGVNQNAYPDILFELDPAYGVSWSVFRPLFGPNVTHRKISGGHTGFGTLLTHGPVEADVAKPGVSVRDIYRIVLHHMGIG